MITPTWLYDGQVDVKKLPDWSDPIYDHLRDWVEIQIGQEVANFLRTDIESISQGYTPEYDLKLKDGTLIEVKVTSGDDRTFNIEVMQEKNIMVDTNGAHKEQKVITDSGLNLSKAHYYAILQKSIFKKQPVYKIKLIATDALREASSKLALKEIKDKSGKITLVKVLNMQEFSEKYYNGFDGFLGSFEYDPKAELLDTTTFTKWRTPGFAKHHDSYVRGITTSQGLPKYRY